MRWRDISSRPKCEIRPTWIRARSCLQAIAEFAFDRAVVALLVHIDEIDDDQAGEVPQPQLPCDFLGGLKIGLEGGILDVMFAGGAAGIDVDRNQRLGLVDHDVAAGSQLHGRRKHRVELTLDAHPRKQRLTVAILPDRAHIRRHQHLHEVAGFLIAGFAGDLDFVDFLVVEIAQRTLDQRAFFVDEGRRLRLQGHVAHGFPHPDQIFEVALDLGLGARCAGGAQDDAHTLGHIEILHHFLQPRAILRRGDLAADAAAARGIGHQNRIASGQRQVCRQRGALVAALFLDDLHQHHLTALDDFLNLVLTARTEGALRHLLHDIVAADGFNHFLLGVLALVFIVMVFVAMRCRGLIGMIRSSGFAGGRFPMRRVVGMCGVFARVLFAGMLIMRGVFVGFRAGRLGCRKRFGYRRGRRSGLELRGSLARVRMVSIGMFMLMTMIFLRVIVMAVIVRMIVIMAFMVMMVGGVMMIGTICVMMFGAMRFGFAVLQMLMAILRLSGLRRIGIRWLDDFALNPLATTAAARIAMARTAAVGAIFGFLFGLAMGAFIRLDQRLAIGDRNLIIIRMDFAEGEEAVTVAAIFDEGGLE